MWRSANAMRSSTGSVPRMRYVHDSASVNSAELVVWSSSGQIQNVTEEGEVVWQLDLDLGQAITFVHYAPSMYAANW